MKKIDTNRLIPFDIEEWRKDKSQKVYTAQGIEVEKLTDFGVGIAPLRGIVGESIRAWMETGITLGGIPSDALRLVKKWELAPPPHGRWHRSGWTEEMLPEGFRPMLDGEKFQPGDEIISCKGNWQNISSVLAGDLSDNISASLDTRYSRTRRTLHTEVQPKPDLIPMSRDDFPDSCMLLNPNRNGFISRMVCRTNSSIKVNAYGEVTYEKLLSGGWMWKKPGDDTWRICGKPRVEREEIIVDGLD